MTTNKGINRSLNQSGTAILEAAVVLVPTLVILFGIIDVCLLMFLQSTFEHASREAVRFATTFQSQYGAVSCASSQFTCITQVAQDNGAGFLSGTKSSYLVVNYYTSNDLTNPVMTCQSGSCTTHGTLPQTLATGVIVNYANQPGNVVEVRISNYPWNWLVPLPGSLTGTGMNLSASAFDVLGGLPGGTNPPTP